MLVLPKKSTIPYRYLRFSSVLTHHHLAAPAPFTRQSIVLPSNVGAINTFRPNLAPGEFPSILTPRARRDVYVFSAIIFDYRPVLKSSPARLVIGKSAMDNKLGKGS